MREYTCEILLYQGKDISTTWINLQHRKECNRSIAETTTCGLQVARDIEDPYLYDPNELPLPQMQYKLNERLLSIAYSARPPAFTDYGGLKGPGNTIALDPNTAPIYRDAGIAVRAHMSASWRTHITEQSRTSTGQRT